MSTIGEQQLLVHWWQKLRVIEFFSVTWVIIASPNKRAIVVPT
jgi:hypothetical protein